MTKEVSFTVAKREWYLIDEALLLLISSCNGKFQQYNNTEQKTQQVINTISELKRLRIKLASQGY